MKDTLDSDFAVAVRFKETIAKLIARSFLKRRVVRASTKQQTYNT